MMERIVLPHDPYNMVITGVGGQGNVLASRLVGEMLTEMGFFVTIGETFGASQRGGSVMSHLRVSIKGALSPQIPKGKAHMVVSLEPVEAIRILKAYGNPAVSVLCNTRPVQPIGVISGRQIYPEKDQIIEWVNALSTRSWFFDPSKEALRLGNPIVSNVITVGALSATGELNFSRDLFEKIIRRKFPSSRIDMNLKAFEVGMEMLKEN